MALRKKTLRTMSPTARKVARLAGEAQSVARRLKNLLPNLQRLDLESGALQNQKQRKCFYNIDGYCSALKCQISEIEKQNYQHEIREAVVKEIRSTVLCYGDEIPKHEMLQILDRKLEF